MEHVLTSNANCNRNLRRFTHANHGVKLWVQSADFACRLLAQQRFRPWNGVFLCDSYLNDLKAAREITIDLLSLYQRNGVVPLVETAVKDSKALQEVMDMFHDADKRSKHLS